MTERESRKVKAICAALGFTKGALGMFLKNNRNETTMSVHVVPFVGGQDYLVIVQITDPAGTRSEVYRDLERFERDIPTFVEKLRRTKNEPEIE